MSDEIDVKEPDWKDIPDYCPDCGQHLERDLDDGGLTGWKFGYRDGESTHGEYSEAYCLSCKFPLQRHYEDVDLSPTDDQLIDPEPWVYRAKHLERDTGLKHREAQVRALKEENLSHAEIAEQLDVSESTVGEYSRRINNRIEEGIRTLEEIGQEVDPLRHIEAQLDGWVATPANRWVCERCDSDLNAGDSVTVVNEYVGRKWKLIAMFCDECEPDTTGGRFAEASDYDVMYAVVDGQLDMQGDDYVDVRGAWDSRDSLTLQDPEIREIIN